MISQLLTPHGSQTLKTQFHWLGSVEYGAGLAAQQNYWNLAQASLTGSTFAAHILALEHPAVITLGKRGDAVSDLNLQAQTDVAVFKVDRGGQATLHSPGQLVIYPIVPLASLNIGVLNFVSFLHRVTVRTLKSYGIQATCLQNQGLFTQQGKLAFTGMRIDKGVSRHGMAINISNDLELFNKIRACGVQNALLDKVENHCIAPSLEDFFKLWVEDYSHSFASAFTSAFAQDFSAQHSEPEQNF